MATGRRSGECADGGAVGAGRDPRPDARPQTGHNLGPARWLAPDQQRAWRAHLATSKLLARQLDRELQSLGLSLNDYEILVALSEAPRRRLRMTELADATAQSRSRLSHQVTRLTANGLVRRDTCPGDRRGLYAVLTDQGLATIRSAAPRHVDGVRRHFVDRLTAQQLAAIRDGYGAVLEHLMAIRDRD